MYRNDTPTGSCANGNCRSMSDLVARPALYSNQQTNRSLAPNPQPPRQAMPMAPPSQQLVTPQQNDTRPSPVTVMPTREQTLIDNTVAMPDNQRRFPSKKYSAIGILVCAKCCARGHALNNPACAQTCIAGGSPVALFEHSTTSELTLLLTQAPKIAPLVENRALVKINGNRTENSIGKGGAVLVDEIYVADPKSSQPMSLDDPSWIRVMATSSSLPSPQHSPSQAQNNNANKS